MKLVLVYFQAKYITDELKKNPHVLIVRKKAIKLTDKQKQNC